MTTTEQSLEPQAPHEDEHGHGHEEGGSSGRSKFWALTVGCIGVVYGDIGTSPLYAFREAVVRSATGGVTAVEVYGTLSLIVWALVVVVTLKYVLFLLRADNRGEGGILSLMALARKAVGSKNIFVLALGIAGAALFYGDAAITPAISVLSAVEGLNLVTPAFEHYVLPISVVILVGLFMVQKKGTGSVSSFFGPITIVWFLALGAAGIPWIVESPEILGSISPHHAVAFISSHGKMSLIVLGAVFLAVTGGEALYADLGHFGRKPIQAAWIGFIFPCLVLNYMGQGALVLSDPLAIENPFFLLVPEYLLLPMVVLATVATIIASQAVITGAYSLTRQAIQLGILPRMEIRHTSAEHAGQIYMPKINTYLLFAVLLLCAVFRTSSALASAYGIAVTLTMVIDSMLAFVVVWKVWKKSPLLAAGIVLPLLAVEVVFVWSNALKIFDGGFVPLCLAGTIMMMMGVWVKGTRYLYRQANRRTIALADLIEMLDRSKPHVVDGTAIFLTSDPQIAPVALLQNLKHNKVLHSHNVILTVATAHMPKVEEEQRLTIEHLSSRMTRVVASFGYMETPNVPQALILGRKQGLNIDLQEASYFLGRRTIISSSAHRHQEELALAWRDGAERRRKSNGWRGKGKPPRISQPAAFPGLPEWQDHIFIMLSRAAVAATEFFHIPRNQAVELGQQVAV